MSRKRLRSPGGTFLRATALISVVASRLLAARSEDIEFSFLFFAFWLPCCLALGIWHYVQSDRSLSHWIRVWGFLDTYWWGPIVGLAFAVLTSPDVLGLIWGSVASLVTVILAWLFASKTTENVTPDRTDVSSV
jgi:hypothetical protein